MSAVSFCEISPKDLMYPSTCFFNAIRPLPQTPLRHSPTRPIDSRVPPRPHHRVVVSTRTSCRVVARLVNPTPRFPTCRTG